MKMKGGQLLGGRALAALGTAPTKDVMRSLVNR